MVRPFRTILLVLLLSLLMAAQSQGDGNIQTVAGRHRVLVLDTYQTGLPIPESIDRGILAALREGGFSVGDVFMEHLDFARVPSDEHRANLVNLLRSKLADKYIDVVISIGATATDFMVREGKSLFPDAAVLALISPNYQTLSSTYDRVMNIPWQVDPAGTLRAALDLFPKTRQVFVVTGARDSILPFLDQARKAFVPWQGKLEIEYSNKMTYDEMLRRVAALPPNSIVIYSPFFTDSTGRAFVPAEVVVKVCQASTVPVFATLEQYLGSGIVGGSLLKTEDIGRQAGKVTLDYLNGSLKLTQPVTTFDTTPLPEFDWRQLVRWKADSSRLPKESILINRPPTLWGQYKVAVIVAATAILVMALLVVALSILNRRLRRTTIAANESESTFRKLFEDSSDAILLIDATGVFVECNKAALDLLKLTREQFILLPPDRISPEFQPDGRRSAEVAPEMIALAYSKGLHRFDWTCINAEGGEFIVEVSLMPVTVKGQTMLHNTWRDITERKQAEDRLRESESRFRTLVNTIPDLIWLKDADGVYLSCNAMFERFFGAKEAEIVGKTDYDFVDKELADFFREHDRKAMAAGKPSNNEEWITFPDNGQRALLYTTKTPMYDNEGKLVGILGVGRDIGEIKRNADERARLEDQLQQAQKMESVGRLAGGVAHDFNNLLTVILGGAHLALSELEPGQPLYEYVTQIKKAGEKSADLTQQLLAFARKQTIAPKVLDLNETVASMLKMLQRLIGEDIELTLRTGNNLWQVKADSSQIDQILANLCVNARDSITDIGTITIQTGNSVIDEGYNVEHADVIPGEYVHISVSDSGCGMDKETMAHIFEPFYTTKGVGEGTGLGLATVYGAAKQNNGFVDVYSEPGIGSTFTIYLPKYVGDTDQMQAKGQVDPAPRGLETVLLVEDEPAILNMTRMILTKQGYTVLAAHTPGEAIRLAGEQSGALDLLITDVVMPEMNGKDLAHTLLSLHPHLKCLFMSGYTADVIAHHGVLDEGVHFIHKPFTLPDLAVMVRKVLDGN